MSWIATVKGSVDHLEAEVAHELENAVMHALADVVGTLVQAGHTGVGGLFHFTTGAPANLTDPDADPVAASASGATVTNPVSTVPAEARTTSVPAGTAPD